MLRQLGDAADKRAQADRVEQLADAEKRNAEQSAPTTPGRDRYQDHGFLIITAFSTMLGAVGSIWDFITL